MNSYKITYSDELYHHGILGQKWGDKNGPPYPLDAGDHSAAERKAGWSKSINRRASNITKYGWKRGHAMNVANRIHENVSSNYKRSAMMSARQKESLKKAEQYWNARARGEEAPKRNIIARIEDSRRAASLGDRVARAMIRNMGTQIQIQARRLDQDQNSNKSIKIGQAAAASAMATGRDIAVEELLNKAFGHF